MGYGKLLDPNTMVTYEVLPSGSVMVTIKEPGTVVQNVIRLRETELNQLQQEIIHLKATLYELK